MTAQRQQGFTLVEVMVALMILAIALPALMFQLGSQLDSRRLMQERLIASWVARDQLALLGLQQRSGQGAGAASEVQGQRELAGRMWFWQRDAEPSPAPGLLRHTIRVALSAVDAQTSESAVLTLDAYLPSAAMQPLSPP